MGGGGANFTGATPKFIIFTRSIRMGGGAKMNGGGLILRGLTGFLGTSYFRERSTILHIYISMKRGMRTSFTSGTR